MGSKIGTILSMIFLALFFTLGMDLMSIQYIYSDLDAKAVSISYIISKAANITERLTKEIEDKYQVDLIILNGEKTYKAGEIVSFQLQTYYHPLIMSKNDMTIKVTRDSIIGYYS